MVPYLGEVFNGDKAPVHSVDAASPEACITIETIDALRYFYVTNRCLLPSASHRSMCSRLFAVPRSTANRVIRQ
ncbi:hypothetical protein BAUCODRAFT_335704 [Baudoinia panamericana UAMH 10762]|uniref:Uncharacterized protein n=1 Tax=Baudoinia panamericana (strain UAMH 10762) TaxID=717646 RepID=M2LAM4_BAUPA|nr:uncharacterized protein BAUCODRAFT_335704 [Baudoinia panamericana UAMH 10762]EMC90867.1 hypothetical protein BAUCODRAFT_335704 [Baudoinia panamericana UAMH 10762]